jgi:energy-coupling factor transport system substrate-specific component
MTANTADNRTDQAHQPDPDSSTERSATSWRTVDIVVASAVAAAFGVVFWAWGNLWNVLDATFATYPPGRAFMYGMWLVPGVLGALLIRKRGAAIYTQLVASLVSVLLGTSWGLNVAVYGLIEGAAAEIVFAFVLYKSWRLPVALAAGACAGASAALMDLAFYYPDWSGGWQLVYGVLVVASSTVLAGLGSWLVVRALAGTGVLAPFASGRDQVRV